jgi:hypothetical protein
VVLIDEQGRLFGLVNVVDVLVVLLVVAVVIAGIALVDPFDEPPEQATHYATIDLGTQPDYLVERVDTGDRMDLENSPDNLTITDVYRGPADNGTQLLIQVQLNGERIEDPEGLTQFLFGGEPFLVGQSLTIETIDYTVSGQVTRIDVEGSSIPTATTSVLATTSVSRSEAEQLSIGDAYRVGGQSVAVLRSIHLVPTPDGNERRALLGLDLSTIARGPSTQFGPSPVRIGNTIPFQTEDYDLQPRILELGSTDIPTTKTSVVLETTVPASVVADVQTGDEFTIGGNTVAALESVLVYPTSNRSVKHVVAGATLTIRVDGDRDLFAGREVSVGTTVPFRTAEYDFTGEILRRGSTSPPGQPTTTTATLELTNVRPEIADSIVAGQTETVRGETLARITGKTASPAVVILEAEDGNIFEREHPRNLDLTLTVELQTRETTTGLSFHGRQIQIGDTIVLDLGPITVQAELTGISG